MQSQLSRKTKSLTLSCQSQRRRLRQSHHRACDHWRWAPPSKLVSRSLLNSLTPWRRERFQRHSREHKRPPAWKNPQGRAQLQQHQSSCSQHLQTIFDLGPCCALQHSLKQQQQQTTHCRGLPVPPAVSPGTQGLWKQQTLDLPEGRTEQTVLRRLEQHRRRPRRGRRRAGQRSQQAVLGRPPGEQWSVQNRQTRCGTDLSPSTGQLPSHHLLLLHRGPPPLGCHRRQ
mmetsp:Transcript_15069/g.56795  ORF Transcript_15069/g.56795 Transcript_15069/m.56795 type:complete len:228 (+) Transcript_15069:170-853(+)